MRRRRVLVSPCRRASVAFFCDRVFLSFDTRSNRKPEVAFIPLSRYLPSASRCARISGSPSSMMRARAFSMS